MLSILLVLYAYSKFIIVQLGLIAQFVWALQRYRREMGSSPVQPK